MTHPFRSSLPAAVPLAATRVAAPAHSATVGLALASFQSTFHFNGGGPLPAWIVAAPGIADFGFSTASSLDSPGAVDVADKTTLIARTSPDDESRFFRQSTSAHASDPTFVVGPGSRAASHFYTYGVRVVSPEPPNAYVARDLRGQANDFGYLGLSDSFAATALAAGGSSPLVVFSNLTDDDYLFTLSGSLRTRALAEVTGMEGFAESLLSTSLGFGSHMPLAVSFSGPIPDLPVEKLQGTGATGSIECTIDVSGSTGLLGLTATRAAARATVSISCWSVLVPATKRMKPSRWPPTTTTGWSNCCTSPQATAR